MAFKENVGRYMSTPAPGRKTLDESRKMPIFNEDSIPDDSIAPELKARILDIAKGNVYEQEDFDSLTYEEAKKMTIKSRFFERFNNEAIEPLKAGYDAALPQKLGSGFSDAIKAQRAQATGQSTER